MPKWLPGTKSVDMNRQVLITRIYSQIALLSAGKPLLAFDNFFHPDGTMYANDVLFAKGATEARAKQEPYITAATEVMGRIEDLYIDNTHHFCRFRNRTKFTRASGEVVQIDGLVLQHWQDNLIIEERYYDGELLASKLQKITSTALNHETSCPDA